MSKVVFDIRKFLKSQSSAKIGENSGILREQVVFYRTFLTNMASLIRNVV